MHRIFCADKKNSSHRYRWYSLTAIEIWKMSYLVLYHHMDLKHGSLYKSQNEIQTRLYECCWENSVWHFPHNTIHVQLIFGLRKHHQLLSQRHDSLVHLAIHPDKCAMYLLQLDHLNRQSAKFIVIKHPWVILSKSVKLDIIVQLSICNTKIKLHAKLYAILLLVYC